MMLLLLMLSLTVETVTPLANEEAFNGHQAFQVVLRNNSAKTITAFSFSQHQGLTESIDLKNVDGIEPGKTYQTRIYSEDPVKITGVVFADGTYEGEEAKEILAGREGVRRAEKLTARQVRTFLQFNTVMDDSAMAVLDRELEENETIPKELSRLEKAAWNEGFVTTRQNARKRIKELPESHRLEQLKKLGREK